MRREGEGEEGVAQEEGGEWEERRGRGEKQTKSPKVKCR